MCVGDIPEQINSSTLVSPLKNLRIISEDKEIQESYDQGAKGSQSGQQLRQPKYSKTQVPANEASVSSLTEDNQQNTPVTVGASNNQVLIYKKKISQTSIYSAQVCSISK